MICKISEVWEVLEDADDSDEPYSLGDCREWVERIFLDSNRLSEIRDMRIEWEEGYDPHVSGSMEASKDIVADAAGMRAADAEKLDILKWHGVEVSWLAADQKKPSKSRHTYGDPLCTHIMVGGYRSGHTCTKFAVDSGDMCAVHSAARLKRSEKAAESPGLCCVLVERSAVCKKLVVPGGFTCLFHTQEHVDDSVRSALEVLRRSSDINKWHLENPNSDQP